MASCAGTKELADNEYRLCKNKVYINGKRTSAGKLKPYLKQKPNKRLLGIYPFYMHMYNWGNPEKEEGFYAWLAKVGEEPVITDSIAVKKSATQLELYYKSKGYFHATSSYEIERKKNNKSYVNYYINTGKRYFIRKIYPSVDDPSIKSVMDAVNSETLLESGIPYDEQVLDDERVRLTKVFQNKGYHYFTKDLISYEIDSALGSHQVDVIISISDRKKRLESTDSIITLNHNPFYINKVFIQTDYSSREDNTNLPDTNTFLDYTFANRLPIEYTFRTITDAIHFGPDDLYRIREVEQTYRHFARLKLFKYVNIRFTEDPGDKDGDGLICYISLSAFKKQAIGIETEGTNTSGNLGINGSIVYQNRNSFNGGEILEVRLTGALESQAGATIEEDVLFNTSEFGIETSIKFPRFLLPFNTIGLLPKRYLPSSSVNFAISNQSRVDFDRLLFRTGLSYDFYEGKYKQHTINLIDLNFVQLRNTSSEFQEFLDQQNSLTTSAFLSNFVSTSGYTFTYNNQDPTQIKNHTFFRGQLELAGNTLNALSGPLDFEVNPETGQRQVLGVSYAQYAKVNIDYRYFWAIDQKQTIGFRLFGGVVKPYGNVDFVPFDRQYFAGGSNDVRAWQAYTLGLGNVSVSQIFGDTVPSLRTIVGDVKLLASVEYRFPIVGQLLGGIFIDAGNIWAIENQEADTDILNENFKFSEFYKDLAVGSGIGLRYDFNFFVIRLDMAYKIYDPNILLEENFLPESFALRNATFNFAIGYPF